MKLVGQDDAATSTLLAEWPALPYWMLGGYLLVLLVLGLTGWYRSGTGEEDYYLAGRRQGWLVSSLTIMATFFSSFALLGAPGMVYRDGVVFALFSLNVPVGGMTVYLLGSRIWRLGQRYGYVTPGDMVSDYYQSRSALRLLVALTGFLYAIPYIVMQIQAGGIVSQQLFGEERFAIGASVLAAVTMVYIMIGGMRSVAWTDVLQGLLLISGMLIGGMAMFLVFDGPANFGNRLTNELPASSLTAPGNSGQWTWTRTLSLCILASTGSMIQPAQWMRYYAASGLPALRRCAVIFSVVLTGCFLLGVMLIGLAGQLLYPLQFEASLVVPDAPAQLDQPTPPELADHFDYQPPDASTGSTGSGQIAWTWSGKSVVPPTRQQVAQLQGLSANESYRAAVGRLAEQLIRIGNNRSLPADRPLVLPHPRVDPEPAPAMDFDAILVVVLNDQLPRVLGHFGAVFASLMLIAIMAASMSTADSNLHALSAVFTRDIYDQFIDPKASEKRRVAVGRLVIVAATVISLVIVIGGRGNVTSSKYGLLNMIANLGFLAIAFSAQLLPLTIDMLFLRRGTRTGAAVGLAAGLFGVCLFGPPLPMLVDLLGSPAPLNNLASGIDQLEARFNVDPSVWGLLFNVPVFMVLSLFGRPLPAEHRARFVLPQR